MAACIPTRRALMRAIAVSPAILSAVPAFAFSEPDAAIEAAWSRRVAAYADFNALPANTEPLISGHSPRESELWNIIDEAEEVIRSTIATTPRGVMLQLWCAMYHAVVGGDDDLLTQGDFAAIDRSDSELDWHARLTLAALRSLQSMEG